MELTNNYDGIKSFKRDLESPWPAENQEVKRSKEDTHDEENKITKQDDSADKDADQKGKFYLNYLIK
jgi:hypothetical protein